MEDSNTSPSSRYTVYIPKYVVYVDFNHVCLPGFEFQADKAETETQLRREVREARAKVNVVEIAQGHWFVQAGIK